MSYLTPGKKEVGYSLTRARREKGYRREQLPRFGRIPSRKATLLWLALRYGFIDKSILVVTEGLGPQKFHGRVVILVNEHTASAGEMVAAFAEENQLANHRRRQDPWPIVERNNLQSEARLYSRFACSCISHLARKNDRGQRSIAEYPS